MLFPGGTGARLEVRLTPEGTRSVIQGWAGHGVARLRIQEVINPQILFKRVGMELW